MLRLPLLALLALGASACGSSSEVDCGPVTGTIAVTEAQVLPDLARISPNDARAAALVEVPGATVTDIDLDEEDGFLVYDVELTQDRTEFDVVVDAGTGDILCSERD